MLMPMEAFYYAYVDVPDALHALAERMTPFYERMLDVMCASDAEVVWWGANYDQSTTWPPFFAKEIVPYVAHVGDRLRAAGKLMASHCDGENDRLLPHLPDARFDIAESVPTEPMTKCSLKTLREGMGETTTIWGGLPATAFMPGPMSDASFEKHLDKVFGELGSGKRLILGVSDNVPPDVILERLDLVTERVKAFGPVTPSPTGQL
jgi:uroporphyrinogen-III decarboxylase